MGTAGDILLVVVGVLIVIMVLDAAIRTFVLPRGTVVTFTALVFMGVRRVLSVFGRASHGYERRDRVMSVYAPLSLLALPAVSLILVFAGYACMYVGVSGLHWRDAIDSSGSSLLTLGFSHPNDLPGVFLTFSEATIGLAVLALLIAYLPTIYNAFSRREIAVTDLSIRAGTPPTPYEWLVRAHRTGFLTDMDRFWEAWTIWFTEVGESHTTYGALAMFRSPNPHRSWITAAGAVLDTASFRLAALDLPWSASAPLCIRSGFVALREVAGFFGFEYEDDPAPDDPISVARAEFDGLCDQLELAGLPLKTDRDQAWRDFAGWRVNYDSVLLGLAAFVMAPYAPWVSDRSPRQPARRYALGRRRSEIARRPVIGPR
ncbi:MAG TPA: hypothetical protein VFR41_02560 [Acidimicrobiia bacterium]|nr:hypothetical protein [Acidimicrobiia bacterium]